MVCLQADGVHHLLSLHITLFKLNFEAFIPESGDYRVPVVMISEFFLIRCSGRGPAFTCPHFTYYVLLKKGNNENGWGVTKVRNFPNRSRTVMVEVYLAELVIFV
jgi:hypothetical protein